MASPAVEGQQAMTEQQAQPTTSPLITALLTPATQSLLHVRQYDHVTGLDTAYAEGFTVMRDASGQDVETSNLLADSYGPYLAFRRQLLHLKLLGEHGKGLRATAALAQEAETLQPEQLAQKLKGAYTPNNRFLLGQCGSLEANSPVATAIPVSSQPGSVAQQGSYALWRRALLAHRFESRKGAAVSDMYKLIAAEKMQKAMAAEMEERESSAGAGAGGGGGGGRRSEPYLWRIKHHFDSILAANAARSNSEGTGRGRQGAPLHPLAALQAELQGLSLNKRRSITAVAFANHSNDAFAVGYSDGNIDLCSVSLGQCWTSIPAHNGAVTGLSWSVGLSDPYVVSISTDRTLRLWKVQMPRIVSPPASSSAVASRPPAAGGAAAAGAGIAAGAGGRSMSAGPVPRPVASTPGAAAGGAAAAGTPSSADAASSSTAAAAAGAGTPVPAAGPPRTPIRAASAEGLRAPATPNSAGSTRSSLLFSPGRVLRHSAMQDKESERERVKREFTAELAVQREQLLRSQGLRLEGGSASIARQVRCDYPLTHVSIMPGNTHLVVVAGVEETDLDAEAAASEEWERARQERRRSKGGPGAGAGGNGGRGSSLGGPEDFEAALAEGEEDLGGGRYALDPSNGAGAGGMAKLGNASVAGAKAVGRLLNKGILGSLQAMKVVGGTTMDVIEAVPLVGDAVGAIKDATTAAVRGVVGGKKERRGHLLVIDSNRERVIQSRKVQGSKVDPLTLQKPSSYCTGLTFSSNGGQLFVSDARGLLHSYTCEPDAFKQLHKLLTEHHVLLGEGSNTLAPISGSGSGSSSGGAGEAPVFLSDISYRPFDAALRCALILGVDNSSHVRAVKLPEYRPEEAAFSEGGGPGGKTTAAAAMTQAMATAAKVTTKIAVEVAVGAVEVMTAGLAQVGPSLQAQEIPLLHYLDGLPQAVLGMGSGGSSWQDGAGGAAGSGTMGRWMAARLAAASSSHGRLQGVPHSCLALSRGTDGLFVGNAAGEIFFFNPHAGEDGQPITRAVPRPVLTETSSSSGTSSSSSSSLSSSSSGSSSSSLSISYKSGERVQIGLGDLLYSGSQAASGSGVLQTQLVCKMVGHIRPMHALHLSRNENFLLSRDAQGRLLAWERVPLEQVLREDASSGGAAGVASAGYIHPLTDIQGGGATTGDAAAAAAAVAAVGSAAGFSTSTAAALADYQRAGAGGEGFVPGLPSSSSSSSSAGEVSRVTNLLKQNHLLNQGSVGRATGAALRQAAASLAIQPVLRPAGAAGTGARTSSGSSRPLSGGAAASASAASAAGSGSSSSSSNSTLSLGRLSGMNLSGRLLPGGRAGSGRSLLGGGGASADSSASTAAGTGLVSGFSAAASAAANAASNSMTVAGSSGRALLGAAFGGGGGSGSGRSLLSRGASMGPSSAGGAGGGGGAAAGAADAGPAASMPPPLPPSGGAAAGSRGSRALPADWMRGAAGAGAGGAGAAAGGKQ